MQLSPRDLEDLRRAKALLEHPSLAARITNVLGAPIETGLRMLPKSCSDLVTGATRKALEAALRVAMATMVGSRPRAASNRFHKAAVAFSGAAGGAFGLAGLSIELPITTALMMRSIADVARSEGEPLANPESRLACVEVLALGGRSRSDNAVDTGYLAVRAGLARALSEAAEHLASRGLTREGAPALVRLMAQVADRFGIAVSEKIAVEAIPIIGAASGAVINVLFIDHFQAMSRGHFIVRRLERTHPRDVVEQAYLAI